MDRPCRRQCAVERLLEIIGEAANHLSPELKEHYPTAPWRSITDLRNVVSHEYFQVRLEASKPTFMIRAQLHDS
jgi:uncharacterized protein with HEPN domain